jgi:LAO/AO transport system kinase
MSASTEKSVTHEGQTLPSLDWLLLQARGIGPHAVRAAGRLMSLVENQPQRLPELLKAAGPDAPEPRLVLGITGAPGSGKSTLTDAIVSGYRLRAPKQRIGVIAVDPSSPFSGGAVLGDRVRMMRHATDPMVFVRSLASRGHLGGLTTGVKGVLRVMGLIGIDVVIIETVGVGQSEVEVARVADEVLVVLAPGQGDSVQLLKAGLLEIGDTIVINKADRPGADELHAQVLAALKLENSLRPTDYARHVALVSAVENQGISALMEHVHARAENASEERVARRAENIESDIREAILEGAHVLLRQTLEQDAGIRSLLTKALKGEADADVVVCALLSHTAHLSSQLPVIPARPIQDENHE